MNSLWNENEAKKCSTDLDLRVYTSRLLGVESSLVLHGGGNTSVKSIQTNLFKESEDILLVKGSGWDLATIKGQGFAPVKMDMLLKMAKLQELNDTNMVKYQRMAMTDPSAPNPSVEAILHAIIPFKFVDHTHTDAVVTITNTDNGEDRIRKLYGDKVLIIPYIMPGFVLAKLVYDMTRDIDWNELEGMVLMNHGLFTFDDDAKKSYEKTISLVTKAEQYLQHLDAVLDVKDKSANTSSLQLAKIRKEVSRIKGCAIVSIFNDSNEAIHFSEQDIDNISQQGPLTPDHVIRTKRIPAILSDDFKSDLNNYVQNYKKYFNNHKTNETLLNTAPNFAILPHNGSLSFGTSAKEANIIKDINNHTYEAILKAEKLGGYKALSPKHIFDVEYWELEQAKLNKGGQTPKFAGKIAMITNGMSEASLIIANRLISQGATIVMLDNDLKIKDTFHSQEIKGIQCDLNIKSDIQNAIDTTIRYFGGIDIIISNTNEDKLIHQATPYLKLGIDPTIIMITNEETLTHELNNNGIKVSTINPQSILSKKNALEDIGLLVSMMAR